MEDSLDQGQGMSEAADREGSAEARAAVLARRVAALEAVVAIERRLRQVQEPWNGQRISQAQERSRT